MLMVFGFEDVLYYMIYLSDKFLDFLSVMILEFFFFKFYLDVSIVV